MFTPTLFNLVKSSLKTFYDIDPLVVDHMVLRTTVQFRMVCSRSVEIISQARQAVCENFTIQPLESVL